MPQAQKLAKRLKAKVMEVAYGIKQDQEEFERLEREQRAELRKAKLALRVRFIDYLRPHEPYARLVRSRCAMLGALGLRRIE
jgi:hypothetical protein